MANNFYIGEMSVNKESTTNELSRVIDEKKQDDDYINTYGFGTSNVYMPAKDTFIIKGKDANGKENERAYTTIEVLSAITGSISSRIRKYIAERDGYYRFFRSKELEQEGIKIEPLDVHNVFYNMIANEYDKNNNERMEYLKNELISGGLTIIPELFENSEEVRNKEIKETYETIMRSDIAMNLYEIESARRIYASKLVGGYKKGFITILNHYEYILKKEITKYIDNEEKDEHLYTQIAIFPLVSSGINEFIASSYNAQEGVTDQDVIAMFDSFLGKEKIAEYIKSRPNSIIERKQVVKYLIKKRIYIRRAA